MNDVVTLPSVPSIKFLKEDGSTLLECSLLKMNTLVAEAQAGLDTTNANYAEVYCSRLAYAINQEFKTDVSDEQAYLIGEHVSQRLRVLKENFGKGR